MHTKAGTLDSPVCAAWIISVSLVQIHETTTRLTICHVEVEDCHTKRVVILVEHTLELWP